MLNKTIVLIISLATTYGCLAQSCKTDLASIVYAVLYAQQYHSKNTVNHLEQHYTDTLAKCMKNLSKEELYTANKKYAHSQKDKKIQEAHNEIATGYAVLGNRLLEIEVPHWERVIAELEKREAQK